jgi:type VI secretion system ImpM family protein
MLKPGIVGKMPAHGDFVRFNANGPVWRAFDEWIQEGYFLAREHETFADGYRGAEGYAFLYTPNEAESALLGYLQPSADTIGRKYPVIIGVELGLNEYSGRFYEVPVRYKGFLDAARRMASDASAGRVDRDRIVEWLEDPALPVAAHHGAEGSYDAFRDSTTWKRFVENTCQHFENERKYLLFKNLVDLTAPLSRGVLIVA